MGLAQVRRRAGGPRCVIKSITSLAPPACLQRSRTRTQHKTDMHTRIAHVACLHGSWPLSHNKYLTHPKHDIKTQRFSQIIDMYILITRNTKTYAVLCLVARRPWERASQVHEVPAASNLDSHPTRLRNTIINITQML